MAKKDKGGTPPESKSGPQEPADRSQDTRPAGAEVVAQDADGFAATMPNPQQHAIDATQAALASDAPPPNADSAGVAWDETKHSKGADGLGVKNANGTWRVRRGSAAGAGSRPRSTSVVGKGKSASSSVSADDTAAKSRAAGVGAARLTVMLGQMLGGEEWKADAGEQAALDTAYADYFVARGMTDLPPGVVLATVLIGYAGKRLAMPQTQAKVGSVRRWFTLRAAKWKLQRELRRRGVQADVTIQDGEVYLNGARFDPRTDVERKVNAGQGAGPRVPSQ